MTDSGKSVFPRRAMLAVFSVLALLTLAGCGDDDEGGDATGATDTVENGTTDPGDEATDPGPDGETAPAPDPDGEAAPVPDGDFCEQMAGAGRYFQPPADGAEYSEYLEVLGAIDPPAEIADAWSDMLDGIVVLQDVDFDDPDALDAAFADPAIEASMEADMEITEFVLEECGTDLDAS